LSDCIESLLRQSFVDIEVILINDGSRDDSGKYLSIICGERFQIIYLEQENKGVSEARNAGLNIARGRFCRLCGR